MANYHLQIATDNIGTGAWSFEVNPLDFGDAFPERAYNRLPTLSGSSLKQFPQVDTRIRRLKFDVIPGTNITHRDFLLGTDEDDTTSLLYLKKLDSDGQLTVHWLNIPDAYQRLRPYGYRETEWIPIRVLDVITQPIERGGTPHWASEMIFEIVPLAETDAEYAMGSSQMGSANPLGSTALPAVYTYDDTGGTYTDRTAEAFAGGTPFPSFAIATSDAIIMGASTPFYGVWIDMSTPETVVPDTNQGATAHVWYYYNSITWATINSVSAVVDNSESFTKDERTVTWGLLTTNTAAPVSTIIAGSSDSTQYYWVKVVIGSVTTSFKYNKILRD